MAVKRFAEYRHFDDGERAAAYRASFRGYTEERLLGLATFCAVAFGLFLNMNDSPARIDPEEAAIAPPTATARRLVEASVSENTRRAYAGALRARAPRRDPGHLPRRVARRRPRLVQRLDDRRRGVLPREARRPAPYRPPGTGEPLASGGAARRGRSGSRTWRPCLPSLPSDGRPHSPNTTRTYTSLRRIPILATAPDEDARQTGLIDIYRQWPRSTGTSCGFPG